MIITQTPLRISIAGGGTDLKAFYSQGMGCVVSTAIDKYIYVIIKERFDKKIYVNYSKREIVDRVEDIKHDLVRETMLKTGIDGSIEVTTLADISSEGTGLGSSSSVTVGLLNALYTFKGESRTQEELAREACEIEIDRVGKPIGKQDQYIAAYGGLRIIRFYPDEHVEVKTVPVDGDLKRRLSSRFLLFFSDITRKSESILLTQQKKTPQVMQPLHQMTNLALRTETALLKEAFEEVGRILAEGWELKRSLVESISNGRINNMYEKAVAAGASGGKICGAGGGGFLFVYCELEHQENVRKALGDYWELPVTMAKHGSQVIFQTRK